MHILVGGRNGEFATAGFFNDGLQALQHGDTLFFREENRAVIHAREHRHVGRGADAIHFSQRQIEHGVFAFREGQHIGINFANGCGGVICFHRSESLSVKTNGKRTYLPSSIEIILHCCNCCSRALASVSATRRKVQ